MTKKTNKTCKGCQHLRIQRHRNMAYGYCSATEEERVVPHKTTLSDDQKQWILTFGSVASFCPYPDEAPAATAETTLYRDR